MQTLHLDGVARLSSCSRSRRLAGLFVPLFVLLAGIAAGHEGAHEIPAGIVTIDSVHPGSPAEAAGLEAGDRVVRLAGREVASYEDLQSVLAAHRPGDTVPLTVERDGKPVELTLTFGERPDGGPSIGVGLAFAADDGEEGTAACLGWIETTYRFESLAPELGLDLADDYRALRQCVARDTMRMGNDWAVKYCPNVFNVHCSGVDLIAEVGDALVRRCEEQLAASTGSDPRRDDRWRTCAQHRVFDAYSRRGEVGDAAACQAALDACRGGGGNASAAAPEPAAEEQSAVDPSASWPQWGGPSRDFRAPAAGLAASWPEDGPPRLWSREIGGGYSAILFEDGRLYTMYRDGADEIVVSLDAGTGETLWEHRYEHLPRGEVRPYGDGPSSTPLLAGDLLFTVGIAGKLQALGKRDGEVVWSRDLWGEDFGGNVLFHGYSSSPVAYEGKVIVPVGGDGAGLVALHQKDGRVAWRALDVRNSFSSPSVVEVAGERQLLAFMAEELVGVDPDDGALLWRYPHANEWHHNISMPEVDGDRIFLSSPVAGARGLRLVRDGDGEGEEIRVEEVWSTRRVQLYHATSVRVGDWVYGSSGTASPAFLTAVDLRTGEIGWRRRGLGKANCVEADGKLVILDENGVLYLATATPEELVVHSRTQLLERVAWTVPTIVGKTLYARNEGRILAVDLG
jgi:outer membrane protein assembly factor BamB